MGKSNNVVRKLLSFLAGTLREPDGKPSSKRITAFWLVGLISFVIGTILLITYLAAFKEVDLKDNTERLIEFVGGTVLLYLIGAVMLLFGVQGWQQISALKVLNPPPKPDTTVIQTGNEQANVNPPTE